MKSGGSRSALTLRLAELHESRPEIFQGEAADGGPSPDGPSGFRPVTVPRRARGMRRRRAAASWNPYFTRIWRDVAQAAATGPLTARRWLSHEPARVLRSRQLGLAPAGAAAWARARLLGRRGQLALELGDTRRECLVVAQLHVFRPP